MNSFNAMRAVYSYFFPEVRPIVSLTSKLDERLFMVSTPVEEAQAEIDKLEFRNRLILPKINGRVDLDEIHNPIIDKVIEAYSFAVPKLGDFKFRYPTSGSSEGIFHIISELKTKGVSKIYTFEGEYEGFKEYGKSLGIETLEVRGDKTIGNLEKGLWFISNPSAVDGNIIPNRKIREICDSGHKVVLDLAYVGSTKNYDFDVSHPNISQVVMSFSKPYGLFRFRIGFAFSRESIDSLYGNKWFKDVGRLITSAKVAEDIGPEVLHEKYRQTQQEIISLISERHGLELKPSDSLLLAYLTKDSKPNNLINPFKRGEGYRFCLTPYYEELEKDRRVK